MKKQPLTDETKQEIIDNYLYRSFTQEELAGRYHVHRKTIYRVLKEAGALPPRQVCTANEVTMLAALRKHKVTPNKLNKLLGRAHA